VGEALRAAFQDVLSGRDLDEVRMLATWRELFDESPSEALLAGFLVALRLKGESGPELTGAARAMLAVARKLDLGEQPLLDTAGTGGDGAATLNISTAAALVAAAAGARVAKHGNRAVSGKCGGADVLERLGVMLDPGPAALREYLTRCNFCFVFAPAYHPLMARFAHVRRELGIRTLFNLLGPLTNPAMPSRQLTGVSERERMLPMAQALAALGREHALVVHSDDGLDEISPHSPTSAIEVRHGEVVREIRIEPTRLLGDTPRHNVPMRVSDADHAAELLVRTLSGQPDAPIEVVALNAGAAIYVSGKSVSLEDGVEQAMEILKSGRALYVLQSLKQVSGQLRGGHELGS